MTKKEVEVNRRGILKSIPVGAAFALTACANPDDQQSNVIPIDFNHGVASGDPLQDRVIIWTRVSPIETSFSGQIGVSWQVAFDMSFANIISSGTFSTDADRDFTVKQDVVGLEAGTQYYYRFMVGEKYSVIGEVKTLNSGGTEPVNLAVASCSNYPFGYFNGYRAIAENGPFDAVLHLGDYIYEYEEGRYGSPNAAKMGRLLDPPHEITTLSDYRRRYALYRADEDLQEVHRKYPFICAWDDHEFANNSYATGAQNHSDDEGDWTTRRREATKAYMEWMPVRVDLTELPTVRSFTFGKLATLAMLDTRIVGRDRPLEYGRDVEQMEIEGPNGAQLKPDYAAFHKRLETEDRSLLGSSQENWLEETLSKSAAENIPWQILGQQIIMSYRPEPPLSEVFSKEEISGFPAGEQLSMMVAEELGGFYNPDAWDGYQLARRRVFDMFEKHAGNPIVLTGDTHCGWAMSLTDKLDGKHYGAEFAVPGITSPGRGERLPKVEEIEKAYYKHLNHMAYANIKNRGYMTLTITEEDSIARFYAVSTVESKEFDLELKKSLRYKAGDGEDGKILLEDITEKS